MERNRSRRIVIASLLSVGIALGGFYIGHAKSGSQPQSTTVEAEPAYLSKLPPNVNLAMLISRGRQLGFSEAEVQSARNASKTELAEFFAAQRAYYRRSVDQVELAEQGKVMNWVRDATVLRQIQKSERPFDIATSRLQMKVAKSLGKKHQLIVAEQSKYRSWTNTPQHAELFMGDEVADKLKLTQVQKNQLVLLTAGVALMATDSKELMGEPLEYDKVAARLPEYRALLRKSSAGFQSYFLEQAVKLLSPRQAFQWEALIRNSEYVQP